MGPAETVRELVAPIVAAEGVELVDCEVLPALVRVTIDRAGGVDLDTISRVNQAVSRAIDAAPDDPVPGGRYTLEVSSPGLERPLRTPEHFRRAVGEQVTVRTHGDVEGGRRVTGELTAADDDGIEVAGRRLAYGQIERARTVFEWGPAPKPGKVGARRSSKTKSKEASRR